MYVYYWSLIYLLIFKKYNCFKINIFMKNNLHNMYVHFTE